jgi:hypothetical protein
MNYEPFYAKAFVFDKVVPGMLDQEKIEDTAKIVIETVKDKVQVNLIINNRAGGKARLVSILNPPEELRKELKSRTI